MYKPWLGSVYIIWFIRVCIWLNYFDNYILVIQLTFIPAVISLLLLLPKLIFNQPQGKTMY